jgi:MarR family transcriptional regulator, organic hydroperoxide resistance regulator
MQIAPLLFKLNRHLNRLAQESPVSIARLEVLRLVKQKNPITLRQLCDIQRVKMPTMSKLVDELQSQGLVIRAQSKDDARQRWIVPTQKGISTLLQLEAQTTAFWEAHLSGLENPEQVVESLKRLTQALSADSSM